MEHAFFLCGHIRAVWFGSNLGFLAHSLGNVDIVEWWKNLMRLNHIVLMQENPSLQWLYIFGGHYGKQEMISFLKGWPWKLKKLLASSNICALIRVRGLPIKNVVLDLKLQ